jgi:hypothetical protein
MKAHQIASPPSLAAPGAGLPTLERLIAKLGIHWLSRRASREQSSARLVRERAAILRLAERCDDASGSRRVLIQRLRGMEDSSRYWSVFMTVEHVRIVNHGIAGTIQSLGRGEVPPRPASTAEVKPDPEANANALRSFDLSCALVERAVSKIDNLRTVARFAHPWFGLLDAGQWHFVAAFHAGLHRQQIELILRQLEADRAGIR